MAKERTKADFDVIVLGGGPDGLACGAYLARKGAKVLLLERKHKVGGSLFTDDFSTPFRYNLQQTYFLLGEETPVYKDFGLDELGVQFIRPPVQEAFLYPDGKALVLYEDSRKSAKAVGRLSAGDADRFAKMADAYRAIWERVLRQLLYRAPPSEEALQKELRTTGPGKKFLALREQTPREAIEDLGLKDDRIRAALLYLVAMFGIHPDAEGAGRTVPFIVHRMMNAAIVKGGSMTLAYAIANRFVKEGGQVLENASVSRIETEDGRVRSVGLEDGRQFTTRAVVSTLNLHQTFLDLLGGQGLPNAILNKVKGWKWEPFSTFTAHFGIKGEPPAYEAAEFNPDVNEALIVAMGIASTEDLDDRLKAIKAGNLPEPAGHGTCTTQFDPLQAAPGPEGPLHTLRFECSAPFALKGTTWDEKRKTFAKACEDLWKAHAPNLGEGQFLFRFVNTPLDVERRWKDMKQGSVHQGAAIATQLGAQRPHPDLASGRTPIAGLYLGGPSIHPGGLVPFGGGYNAAQTLLSEWKR